MKAWKHINRNSPDFQIMKAFPKEHGLIFRRTRDLTGIYIPTAECPQSSLGCKPYCIPFFEREDFGEYSLNTVRLDYTICSLMPRYNLKYCFEYRGRGGNIF